MNEAEKEAARSSLGHRYGIGVDPGGFLVAIQFDQAIRADQSGQQLRVGDEFGVLLILAGPLCHLDMNTPEEYRSATSSA